MWRKFCLSELVLLVRGKMMSRKVLNRYVVFDKTMEIKIPSEYECKKSISPPYVFIEKKNNYIILNDVTQGKKDSRDMLINIYNSIKERKKDISNPVFLKRETASLQQNMLRFSCKNKEYYVFVVTTVVGKQYLLEFTYEGENVDSWNKQWEFILNSFKVCKGGN